MEFIENEIEGLYLINPYHFSDNRGSFVKTFHAETFREKGLETEFQESFYSESVKNVIRGMHFQLPPDDHVKLVFCTAGTVLDVVLDLRVGSKTFGRHMSFLLSGENKRMLYIPKGMAHGFCTMSDTATMFYFTSTAHNKLTDTGIRYDSFGFDWPTKEPIVSDRDRSLMTFEEFESPWKKV